MLLFHFTPGRTEYQYWHCSAYSSIFTKLQAALIQLILSIVRHIAKTSALTDEKTLIHGCVNGLESYRYELYRRYAGKMLAVCKRYAGSKEDAEDYLQESFIKIFDKLPHYKQIGSFEHWLRRIMINTALTYLRLSKKFVNELDVYELGEVFLTETDPLKQLEAKQLMKFIQELPHPQQSVMNLFSIDGYSHQEIAELLGISEAASRVMLHRAKAKLIELCSDNSYLTRKYGIK